MSGNAHTLMQGSDEYVEVELRLYKANIAQLEAAAKRIGVNLETFVVYTILRYMDHLAEQQGFEKSVEDLKALRATLAKKTTKTVDRKKRTPRGPPRTRR